MITAAKYLVQFAATHFLGCTLLTVHSNLSNSYISPMDLVTKESELLVKVVLNIHLTPNESANNKLYSGIHVDPEDSRRFTEGCTVAAIFIHQLSLPHMQNSLNQLIAPSYLPIARKDTDYFLFLADSPLHERILTASFSSSIKYKIALGESESGMLLGHSVNNFHRAKQSSLLVKMNLTKCLSSALECFPDFFWNLNGHTLRVSVPYARALVESSETRYINNGKRGKWVFLLNEYITVKFNCTYIMFPSTGKDGRIWGGSGLQLENGTWIGVIGDLHEGRADLGLGVANTDQRIQYVGFTDAFFDTGCLTFVTGNPTELYSAMALFWPFKLLFWITLVGCTCLVIGIFILLGKIVKSLYLETIFLDHISYQIFAILTPYVEQDFSLEPKSNTLRIFLAFWSFFALVVTNLYRSKLVALLAFPVLGKLPQTFSQLAFSGLDIGFMKNGDSAYNTIVKSTDTVYVEILRKMEIIKGVNLTCLENVIHRDGSACIAYDFDVVYLQQKNLSDLASRKLTVAPATTYNIWMGLATQAHSMYRVNFDKVLRQTQPFHLSTVWDNMDMYKNVRKLKMKWWMETNQTDKLLGSKSVSDEMGTNLEFRNIEGVFHLFAYCVVICIGSFLYEKYSWFRKASFPS